MTLPRFADNSALEIHDVVWSVLMMPCYMLKTCEKPQEAVWSAVMVVLSPSLSLCFASASGGNC